MSDSHIHPLQTDFVKNKIFENAPTEKLREELHEYGEEWVKDRLKEKPNAPPDLSDKHTVLFTFAEAAKKKEIFRGFDRAHKTCENNEEFANLFIPETVTIDYSEYSNVPMFKNNIYTKPYKDGIMLVTNVEKKLKASISLRIASKLKSPQELVDGKIIVGIYDNCFRNFGQIDWRNKNFDNQVVFYVVVPNIVKNKAAKIVFKNNVHLKDMIKLFRSEKPRKLPSGKFKHFYDSTTKAHVVLSSLHHGQTLSSLTEEEKKDPIKVADLKKKNTYSNKELLDAGYQSALTELSNNCLLLKEGFWVKLEEYEKKSLEEIKKEYMKEIFPFTKKTISSVEEKKNIIIKENLLKIATFYYHTNKGKTLCDGTQINTEERTQADNILFWKKIGLFELLFNVLNNKNFPLCMQDSQIINDADIFDDKLFLNVNLSQNDTMEAGREEFRQKTWNSLLQKDEITFNFKNKHILQEAIDSQTGYLMPYDGVFELLHDPIFSFIRFRESENFVIAVLCDNYERYFIEVFDKKKIDFKYIILDQLKFNENYSEECMQDIYTKLATCIRDAKVLIERDSTMQYQGRRKPYGSQTSSVYNIYFPKIRYRRNPDALQKRREEDFFNESKKFSGTRRAHIRRLVSDQKPSKRQLLLAQRLNIHVPDSHTFVKEAEWGNNMTKREVRYRNTALNGLFYYDNKEVEESKKIDALSPAGFEEYCQEYVKKLGYSVKNCQNYDGGIDIRAIKVLENHETEYLLVQCKHWNKAIPPGEIRDFKTAVDEESSEYKKIKMFITSSEFSPGARELAEKFDIKLVDINALLK